MPVALPLVPSVPSYRVGTALDGVNYILDVYWATEEDSPAGGSWYFHLRDENAAMIRAGIRIVLGAFLGRRSVDKRFPRGVLIAADLSGDDRDAGIDDLGTRVVVYFYTPEEVAAL